MRLTMIAAAMVVAGAGVTDAALRNTGEGRKDMPPCYYTRDASGEYVAQGFCNAPYSPTRDGRIIRQEPEVIVSRPEPPKDPCVYKESKKSRKFSDFFRSKKGLRTGKLGKQSLSKKGDSALRGAARAARKAERQAARAANKASRTANREGGRRGKRDGARSTVALDALILEPLN